MIVSRNIITSNWYINLVYEYSSMIFALSRLRPKQWPIRFNRLNWPSTVRFLKSNNYGTLQDWHGVLALPFGFRVGFIVPGWSAAASPRRLGKSCHNPPDTICGRQSAFRIPRWSPSAALSGPAWSRPTPGAARPAPGSGPTLCAVPAPGNCKTHGPGWCSPAGGRSAG